MPWTKNNVRRAFAMYQAVAHDAGARLTMENPGDGATRYAIVNGKFRMHASGAREAVRMIETWVDGYNHARDQGTHACVDCGAWAALEHGQCRACRILSEDIRSAERELQAAKDAHAPYEHIDAWDSRLRNLQRQQEEARAR